MVMDITIGAIKFHKRTYKLIYDSFKETKSTSITPVSHKLLTKKTKRDYFPTCSVRST